MLVDDPYEKDGAAACTILTHNNPSMGLAAAAMYAGLREYRRPRLVVSADANFTDIHPQNWGEPRTVLFVDMLSSLLLGQAVDAHQEVASELIQAGHRVVLDQRFIRDPVKDKQQFRRRMSCVFRTMVHLSFNDASGGALRIAEAADGFCWFRGQIELRRDSSALMVLAYSEFGLHCHIDRCAKKSPGEFREIVKKIADAARYC